MHKSLDKKPVHEPGRQQPLPVGKAFVAGLYQRYFQDLCLHIKASFGMGPPEPEDIAQDVFSKFSTLENIENISNPRAFLWRMANNVAISRKRHEQTRARHVEAEKRTNTDHFIDVLTAERVLLSKEALSSVRIELEKMPRFRRRVLLLNRLHGLSAAKIARRMGVPASTVKTNIYKALEELEVIMKKVDDQ